MRAVETMPRMAPITWRTPTAATTASPIRMFRPVRSAAGTRWRPRAGSSSGITAQAMR